MSDKKAVVKKDVKTAATAAKIEHTFLFGKTNYMLMAAGVLVITLGFFLMSGSEDIFSSAKLTVAPITVVLGFVIEFVAIFYKDKE